MIFSLSSLTAARDRTMCDLLCFDAKLDRHPLLAIPVRYKDAANSPHDHSGVRCGKPRMRTQFFLFRPFDVASGRSQGLPGHAHRVRLALRELQRLDAEHESLANGGPWL